MNYPKHTISDADTAEDIERTTLQMSIPMPEGYTHVAFLVSPNGEEVRLIAASAGLPAMLCEIWYEKGRRKYEWSRLVAPPHKDIQ